MNGFRHTFIKEPTIYKNSATKVSAKSYDIYLKKFKKIIAHGYVSDGPVVSFTDCFSVPKGKEDIRMVYNGTSCGLNSVLFVPNFWIPTARIAVRTLGPNSFSVDMDLVDCF